MSDSLDRLYQAVVAAQAADPASSRTARLLRSGRSKMAKKLAEEAVEVAIDTMHGDCDAMVRESADLLYNLVVLWVAAGIHPKDVWMEMERRERLLGIAEKLPKERPDAPPPRERPDAPPRERPDAPPRRKVIALDRSRVRKRR
ncbi:MAG TPA: phosphoribosyl-ATP diphosphatase [Xanthobacteraceae bacterium]|jgi:phosphoribosyl-ATP pyrophosphohydrolase|nr:phosphoribosyl-ATP diphosphatase [Xanthobacteraceae bacterium]